jgi:hypothetical protein
MRSHGGVRALRDGLLAALVGALLAGAGVVPCLPSLSETSDAGTAQGPAMDAPPGAAVAATLSVAPAAMAAPLSSASRFVVAHDTLACGCRADGSPHTAAAMKSAPTILRL